jgi:hypothetical protein
MYKKNSRTFLSRSPKKNFIKKSEFHFAERLQWRAHKGTTTVLENGEREWTNNVSIKIYALF